MRGVFENVRSGLINRHGARAGFGIGTLSRVERARAEAEDAIFAVSISGNLASKRFLRHRF